MVHAALHYRANDGFAMFWTPRGLPAPPGGEGAAARRPARGALAVFVAAACLLAGAPLRAQDAAPDCEPRAIDLDLQGRALTRAERIELMDRALYDSLAAFDECHDGAAASASSARGGGQDGGTGGGEGTAGQGDAVESAAARGIEGTEAPAAEPADGRVLSAAAADIRGGEAPAPESTPGPETADARSGPLAGGNGKVPEDIPAADNDGALAAQIRLAAMNEPDPRARHKLWNEYRKYTGLPEQPLDTEGGPADAPAAE